jgi:hypothetical protein
VAAINKLAAPDYFAFTYVTKVALSILVPFLTFWFFLNFSESRLVKSLWARIILITVPALDILMLVTTPIHRLFFTNLDYPDPGISTIPPTGILFSVHIAAMMCGVLFFYALLIIYIAKNYRRYPLLIVTGVGALTPFLLNIAFITNIISLDLSPIGFFFTVVLFAYYSYASKVRASKHNRYSDTLGIITKSPVLSSGDIEQAAVMIAKAAPRSARRLSGYGV